jgi:hypothetical protein
MKNKELVLRRLESVEGKLKRMRNALNERNVEVARELLKELLELQEDIQAIIEREN